MRKHTVFRSGTKNHYLYIILALVTLVIIGIFAFTFDYSSYNQYSYINSHKEQLYLKNNYKYTFTQYEVEDNFDSLVLLEFEQEEDITDLEISFKQDKNIAWLKNAEYASSNFLTENYKSILPFELDCQCYSLYVINASQSRGGYLYHVYVYEKSVIIYYSSR